MNLLTAIAWAVIALISPQLALEEMEGHRHREQGS